MLLELHIKNFVIVEDLCLEFQSGMSVVTGETGAGKSILLDAIEFVLGGRALPGLIRQGKTECEVTAVFEVAPRGSVADYLTELGFSCEEGTVILRRVFNAEGRSKASLNHQSVLLQQLKQLGLLLVDLVGQHEHQRFLRPEVQLSCLDEYAKTLPLREQVEICYKALRDVESRLADLQKQAESESGTRDLKRYQLEELDALAIEEGELTRLHAEQKKLSSVHELLADTTLLLAKLKEEDPNLLTLMRELQKPLHRLAAEQPELKNAAAMWDEASVLLEETGRELTHFHEGLELDPERLQTVEARLSEMYAAARKHHVEPQDLPRLHQQLQAELASSIDFQQAMEDLQKEILRLSTAYQQQAEALSAQRQAAAKTLGGEVSALMKKLGMPQGECQLTFTALPAPSATGLDQLQFLVRINVGQGFEPLKEVASGGELSRIALIMAVLTGQHRSEATLIFDEVDVGISGAVAEQVGDLIHQLAAQGQQILCITHLPQVALKGDQHLQISKRFTAKETFTEAKWLAHEERIHEIARLMSGEVVSPAVLSHIETVLGK